MNLRMMGGLPAVVLATVLGGSVFTTDAQAETLGFTWVPSEDSGSYASIQDKFKVDVTQGSASNLVDFKFTHTVQFASVAEIYFYDNTHTYYDSTPFVEVGDVDFKSGANPADLPGKNSLPYSLPALTFAAESKPGNANGLSMGESLTITLTLRNSQTLNDVLDALKGGSTVNPVNDRYFIGLHVRSLGTGQEDSASFITPGGPGGPPVVPLPPALLAGAVLMGGTALMRRVRRATPGRDL